MLGDLLSGANCLADTSGDQKALRNSGVNGPYRPKPEFFWDFEGFLMFGGRYEVEMKGKWVGSDLLCSCRQPPAETGIFPDIQKVETLTLMILDLY